MHSTNNDDRRTVVVHHHIFKNAGTSFNYALKQAFGENFLEYDLPNSRVVSSDQLEKYLQQHGVACAVSGHHIALPAPQSAQLRTLSSVILRHPLARVRSIYKFEQKQDAETGGAVMAKRLNFKEFVAWRLKSSPRVFCNYQTMYCARTGDVSTAPTEEDLTLAIANLKSCVAVGTVKRYREFLLMAQYEISRFFPDVALRNSHLNVTSKSQSYETELAIEEALAGELGDEIVLELQQNNRLDSRLYRFANDYLNAWQRQDADAKAQYFESLGQKLSAGRDWRGAKAAFEDSISFNSSAGFKAHYGLAESLESIGDADAAIPYYRRSIEYNPEFSWSYFRLGSIFYAQEAFEEALDYYKAAISVHPIEKSALFYMRLGDTLAKLGNPQAALDAYIKADGITAKSVNNKARLVWAYTACEDIDQSKKHLNQLLTLSKNPCEAYTALGDVFSENGELTVAVGFYRKGLEADSSNKLCSARLEKIVQSQAIL